MNGSKVKLEMKAWANCPPQMTIKQFITELKKLGNQIYEINKPERKVLIGSVNS